MPYPLVMTTANTFNDWFGATNNLISELANPNYLLLAGRTTNSASTTRVNGEFSAANLTVTGTSTLTGNVVVQAQSVFNEQVNLDKTLRVNQDTTLYGNLVVETSKNATIKGNLTVIGPIGVGDAIVSSSTITATSFIGNLNADSLASGTVPAARLQSASASQAGIVTTGTQTFAGNKTFQNTAQFNSTVSATGKITAAGELSVGANAAFATNVLFVDSTTGRVGVKTTSPQYDLEINGTIKATSYIGSLAPDTGAIANGTITYVKLSNDTPGRLLMINATGNVQAITISGHASINSTGVLTINTSSSLQITGLNVSSAANVIGTFGVAGAANALGTLGVGGVFTALANSTLTGAVNALSTLSVSGNANTLAELGVGGTLTALGQLIVTGNANFDSGTLFVDSVAKRVGVNTVSPASALGVSGTVTATAFSGSGTSLTGLNASNLSSGAVPVSRLNTVTALTPSGTNVPLDASLGTVFTITNSGNPLTVLAPTNPVNGQRILIKHTASGADRTLSLTTGSSGSFAFGTDFTGLTVTASGKSDYIGCVYDSSASRWHVIGYAKGY